MGIGRPKETRSCVLLTLAVSLKLAMSAAVSNVPGYAQDQDNDQALAARAERLETLGKWEDAAATYREILKINPRSIAALNRLGAIYVRQKKFHEAVQYYRQAQSLNPYEFGTNLNLGIAYIKMQNYDSATAPLERATEEIGRASCRERV